MEVKLMHNRRNGDLAIEKLSEKLDRFGEVQNKIQVNIATIASEVTGIQLKGCNEGEKLSEKFSSEVRRLYDKTEKETKETTRRLDRLRNVGAAIAAIATTIATVIGLNK